eukprot:486712_1
MTLGLLVHLFICRELIFLTLLTRLPSLNHIKLAGVYTTNEVVAQDIIDVCPNIVGLHLDGANVQLDDLITLCATNLKYLSFTQHEHDQFKCDTVSFETLEELETSTPDKQSLHGILKSASNLKKLWIRIETLGICDCLMSDAEIKDAMEEIIVKCPLLTYMRVIAKSSHFSSVLEGIECGLLKTKELQRTELKINIVIGECDSEVKAIHWNVTPNVVRIANLLELSDINDFMIIWCLCTDVIVDEVSKIFNDLCNMKAARTKVYHYTKVSHYTDPDKLGNTGELGNTFVIANQDCKINGYQDSIRFL